MSFYSQNREDEFIAGLGLEINSVLDIGANDGETLSNSRHFIDRYNASAILIEPDPTAFSKLFDLYKHNDRIGMISGMMVSDKFGHSLRPFYPFADSLISTADPLYRDIWEVKPRGMYRVACLDWTDLVAEFGDFGCDLISIDAEGLSISIANSMPAHIIRAAKVIVIERNNVRAARGNGYEKAPMSDFDRIIQLGKRVIHETGENLIFAN